MLSPQQKADRKHRLGASDTAVVLGLPTYSGKNAYDLWLEKTGRLVEKDSENGSIAAGNRFESGVLDEAESRLGPLDRGIFVPSLIYPHIGALLDAKVVASGEPCEAKTAGLLGPLTGDWGDEGTDQVPECYLIQCQTQMLCTGSGICHLMAFLGGIGFRLYEIVRSDELCQIIGERAEEWWADHVGRDAPPSNITPSLDVVKRVRRTPAKTTSVPDEIVAAWVAAKEAESSAKKAAEEAQAALLAAMGDAEAAELADGRKLTYFESTRKGFTVEPTTYRQLRLVKKGKI